MGFYLSQNDQVLNPSFLFPGFSRSTEVEVGRPGRSTDVHRRACLCALEGRSTETVDPPESLCSLENPDRPSGRPTENLFSVPEARSTAAPTVRKMTVGGRPDGRPSGHLAPTASFSNSINWGIWGMFLIRFEENFWASFSYPYKSFFSINLRANISYQKGSFIKSVRSDFLEFFLHHSHPCFLTNT